MTSMLKLDLIHVLMDLKADTRRLRQTDVKAGHFERKVQALEQERDQWITKYEEVSKKFAEQEKQFEDLQAEIGGL